jgi:hypothetical protein
MTSTIVRLMMAQYKGRNMYRQQQNKTNVHTIVSILFFRNILVYTGPIIHIIYPTYGTQQDAYCDVIRH